MPRAKNCPTRLQHLCFLSLSCFLLSLSISLSLSSLSLSLFLSLFLPLPLSFSVPEERERSKKASKKQQARKAPIIFNICRSLLLSFFLFLSFSLSFFPFFLSSAARLKLQLAVIAWIYDSRSNEKSFFFFLFLSLWNRLK